MGWHDGAVGTTVSWFWSFILKHFLRKALKIIDDSVALLLSQVRLPHDDNDMYDRHVLPAGHPHRSWMEHVIHTCAEPKKLCECLCMCVCVCVRMYACEQSSKHEEFHVTRSLVTGSDYRQHLKHCSLAVFSKYGMNCRPSGIQVTGALTKNVS